MFLLSFNLKVCVLVFTSVDRKINIKIPQVCDIAKRISFSFGVVVKIQWGLEDLNDLVKAVLSSNSPFLLSTFPCALHSCSFKLILRIT